MASSVDDKISKQSWIQYKKPNPKAKIRFVAPAHQEFSSLKEQATYFLDNYWANWRNYDQPESYLIPSTYFKAGDEMLEAVREESKPEKNQQFNLEAHLKMATTRRRIYNAIDKIKLDGIQTPFIAAALNKFSTKLLEAQLKEICPNLDEKVLSSIGEYDFILVGEKFGVVIIRIATADRKKENISHRFVQLLQKLSQTEYQKKGVSVCEITVPINVGQEGFVYCQLYSSNEYNDRVGDRRSRTRVTTSSEASFCEMLIKALTKGALMPRNVFEAYGAMVAALSSMIILKEKNENVSPKYLSKVYFLTPEQQKIFHGQNRQFIFGPAGSGKTILLQAKAVQLLNQGESVIVLAPKSIARRYADLFDGYGFTNQRVLCWPTESAVEQLKEFCEMLRINTTNNWGHVSDTIIDFIAVKLSSRMSAEKFTGLPERSHVILDDILFFSDDHGPWHTSFFACLAIMLAACLYPAKYAWVSVDSIRYETCHYGGLLTKDETVFQYLQRMSTSTTSQESSYSIAVLKQVMRCTANIFKEIFTSLALLTHDLTPSLGHRFQGPQPIMINKYCKTVDEMSEMLRTLIGAKVEHLLAEGVDRGDIAIIASNHKDDVKIMGAALAKSDFKVYLSDEICSLEWPIVISVNVSTVRYDIATRAKMGLVPIVINTMQRGFGGICRYLSPRSTRDETHIKIKTSDLSDKQFINQGAFGKVFAFNYRKANLRVAVKTLQATADNEADWKREVELLQRADHPYIVSILDVVDNLAEKEIWIVTELLDAGCLRLYCTGNKREIMTTNDKVTIGYQCWAALRYLHAISITHKDIKPENILLRCESGGHWIAKICDFGVAKLRDALTMTDSTSVAGTPMYFPPELSSSMLNPKNGDVFSLGATFIELFTNMYFWHNAADRKPLQSQQVSFVLIKINDGISLAELAKTLCVGNAKSEINDNQCDFTVVNILKRAVAFDRRERPSASEVMILFENALLPRLTFTR